MDKSPSPQLIISDHYDQLVQEIDINTEKLLDRFSNDDLLAKHWNISDPTEEEPIADLPEYDGSIQYWLANLNQKRNRPETTTTNLPLNSTRVKDYLEKTRSEILKALAKSRRQNLDNLNAIKHKLSLRKNDDQLREQLFANAFCFLLPPIGLDWDVKICKFYHKSFFGAHVVVCEFYLSEVDLTFIKYILCCKDTFKYAEPQSSEKLIWARAVANYLDDLVYLSNSDQFLIHLSKQSIIETISTLCLPVCTREFINLDGLRANGFSKLTSLTIYGNFLQNLHALPTSLEHLCLEKVDFAETSFPHLPNLLYLDIKGYNLGRFTPDWLLSFPALVVLKIWINLVVKAQQPGLLNFIYRPDDNATDDMIVFKRCNEGMQVVELLLNDDGFLYFFENIQTVRFWSWNNFEPHVSECHLGPSSIKSLFIKDAQIDSRFDYPCLQALETLHIELDVDMLEKKNGLGFIRPLVNLKHLIISRNSRTSREIFLFKDMLETGHLASLISFRIDRYRVRKIEPEFFSLMPNLEVLDVRFGSDYFLTKEVLSLVGNLKKLSLSHVAWFGSGVFAHLKKLETLCLKSFSWPLSGSILEGLEGLKTLSLVNISSDVFDLMFHLPLKGLEKLDLVKSSLKNFDFETMVEFFVTNTRVKTVYFSQLDGDKLKFTRLIETEKLRAQR